MACSSSAVSSHERCAATGRLCVATSGGGQRLNKSHKTHMFGKWLQKKKKHHTPHATRHTPHATTTTTSPRELLGVEESGGCVRCSGTNSRLSAWLWQLHSTTVLDRRRNRWSCSSTPPNGDRGPAPEPGRVRCTRSTTLHGDRTHLTRGRPGSLFDPGPQRSDRSLRRSAGDSLPTLALPVLAGSAGEAVDARTLRFLLGRSLAEKEEEQRKAQVEELRQASLARARELHGSKRKRKKRRKRRTLRTSSCSLRGRARRRQRQWHACNAGFPGDVPFRAVFPSVFGRLVMLGIMAGMDQKGFFKFVDTAFVPQKQILMVQSILQTTEFPQLLYVSVGRCPYCAGRACQAALVSTTAVCAQGWYCW